MTDVETHLPETMAAVAILEDSQHEQEAAAVPDVMPVTKPSTPARPLRRLRDLIVKVPRPENDAGARDSEEPETRDVSLPPQEPEAVATPPVVPRRRRKPPKRSSQVSPLRFSKPELEAILPRKSFFSCHDKVLKEAGLGVDDSEAEKKRKKKLNEVMSRVKVMKPLNVMLSLFDTVKANTPAKQGDAAATLEGDEKEAKAAGEDAAGGQEEEEAREREIQADASPRDPKTSGALTRSSSRPARARRKPGELDDSHVVDHKLLTAYLRYVKENPSEYEQYWRGRHPPSALNLDRRLVKMGGVYQRGHHGRPRHRPTLMAAYELWPRFTDPGQWQMTADKKAQAQAMAAFAVKKERVVSAGRATGEKEEDKGDHEEARTEMEKWRQKVDKWQKTLTSGQLIQARTLALREIGEEDAELEYWWLALRSCHYLRQRGSAK